MQGHSPLIIELLQEKHIIYGENLHFIRPCVLNVLIKEHVWAIRISLDYLAVGIFEGDTVTWFWVGNHDDYERFF